jgi:hypothetical protein
LQAEGAGRTTGPLLDAADKGQGAEVPRRRKQDIIVSLRGIAAVIATLLAFIAALVGIVFVERLLFG